MVNKKELGQYHHSVPDNDHRRFTSPAVLKKVSGQRLRDFLSRFEPFFANRGIVLPPATAASADEDGYDYTALSRSISKPDRDSPPAMVDALHLLNEMCSESAHDAMLEAVEAQSINIDLPDDITTAEIALAIWMFNPVVLSNLHVEQLYTVQRRFEFFKVEVAPVPAFVTPTDSQRAEMCRALDAVFKKTRRGEGCRMFVHDEAGENMVRILVQHGQTCKRDGNYINNQPEPLLYRPEVFDTIHFARDNGELAIHCESRTVLKAYLKVFGRHIFDDDDAFKPADKYTLDPLWRVGEACLNTDGVAHGRISSIVLREVTIAWNRQRKDFEIRKSMDLFESMRQRNRTFEEPRNGMGAIIRAKFDVYFSGNPKPRPLTIAPPRDARYERDEDGVYLEEWMTKREFIIPPKRGDVNETSTLDVDSYGTGRSDSDLEETTRA